MSKTSGGDGMVPGDWKPETWEDGVPRVRDVDLAERAGMKAPRQVRELIKRNRAELEAHGALSMRRTVRRISKPNGGEELREVKEFWLNRLQAAALVPRMSTPKAMEFRIALVRAVFGEDARVDPRAPGYQLFARMLRFQAAKSRRKFWSEEIVTSLCTTYKIQRRAQELPAPLLGVIGWIYRTVLTPQVYAEMKARNPRGSERDLHYEWWTDELRGLLDDDVNVIRALSNTSASAEDFKAKMMAHYKRALLQLPLGSAPGLA